MSHNISNCRSRFLNKVPTIKIMSFRGRSHGQVVKFAHSAAGGPVFRWFASWARTWHSLLSHAEAASHMPQLEGPTTKNVQLCLGGLWGAKEKNKIFKKNKIKKNYVLHRIHRMKFLKYKSYIFDFLSFALLCPIQCPVQSLNTYWVMD